MVFLRSEWMFCNGMETDLCGQAGNQYTCRKTHGGQIVSLQLICRDGLELLFGNRAAEGKTPLKPCSV